MPESAPRTTIGILSDTHLREPTETFRQLVAVCFQEADLILHAGDLVDDRILTAFDGKAVHAVHGNMCLPATRHRLPRKTVIEVNGVAIGVVHRAGYSYDFEELLPGEFDRLVQCIVYGHTHRPACHRRDGILFINPGHFLPTSPYGASGTYALLTVGRQLTGRILPTPTLADAGRKAR